MSGGFQADVQRRLANVIQIRTIHEADHAAGRYRAKIGDLLTDWLPFGGQRVDVLKGWSSRTTGERRGARGDAANVTE